jgi:hypothetical protein
MSAVATVQSSAPTLFDGAGGEPMLDETLVRVWEGLIAHRLVDCPVCGAEMRPGYGARALPIGGRCTECGTTIT